MKKTKNKQLKRLLLSGIKTLLTFIHHIFQVLFGMLIVLFCTNI